MVKQNNFRCLVKQACRLADVHKTHTCSINLIRNIHIYMYIQTRHGLEGPGIESRWDLGFPHLSRPALPSPQPSTQRNRVFQGGNAVGACGWPPNPI